jgi:hypothetical protein
VAWQDRIAGIRWRVGAIVAGAVGAFAYMAQIIVGFPIPTWARWILAGAGTLLLFFSIAQPNWQVSREVRARKAALVIANEAVATYDIKVHKLLVPYSRLLAKVVAEADRNKRRILQEKMKQVAVDCALDHMQGTEPRSCFYTYRHSEDPMERKLVLDGTWRGRNADPRNEFVAGDDAGNEALRVLDSRETKFVRDADEDPPPGWRRDRDYRTYIQVAVVSGSTPFGLLMADAVNAGGLTELDRRLIELIALLLGCALGVDKISNDTFNTSRRFSPISASRRL